MKQGSPLLSRTLVSSALAATLALAGGRSYDQFGEVGGKPLPRAKAKEKLRVLPETIVRARKGYLGGATAKGRRFKGSKAAKAAARRVRRDLNRGEAIRKEHKYWRAMAAGSKSGYGPPMAGVSLPAAARHG